MTPGATYLFQVGKRVFAEITCIRQSGYDYATAEISRISARPMRRSRVDIALAFSRPSTQSARRKHEVRRKVLTLGSRSVNCAASRDDAGRKTSMPSSELNSQQFAEVLTE